MSTIATPSTTTDSLTADNPFRYGYREIPVVRPNGRHDFDRQTLTLEDVLHPQMGDVIVVGSIHDLIRDYLADVCRARTADDPTKLVLSDTGVFWDDPDLRHHAPDVGVIPNIRQPRVNWTTFSVAEEQTRPSLIIEIISPNTRQNDVVTKVQQYHQARVRNYVILDRLTEDGPWTLRGYQYAPQKYLEMPKDEQGRLWLEEINVLLGVDGLAVRCYDALTNTEIGNYTELSQQLVELQARTAAAEARAEAAEAKVRDLEPSQARAEAAEAMVRELQSEIARLKGQPPEEPG